MSKNLFWFALAAVVVVALVSRPASESVAEPPAIVTVPVTPLESEPVVVTPTARSSAVEFAVEAIESGHKITPAVVVSTKAPLAASVKRAAVKFSARPRLFGRLRGRFGGCGQFGCR